MGIVGPTLGPPSGVELEENPPKTDQGNNNSSEKNKLTNKVELPGKQPQNTYCQVLSGHGKTGALCFWLVDLQGELFPQKKEMCHWATGHFRGTIPPAEETGGIYSQLRCHWSCGLKARSSSAFRSNAPRSLDRLVCQLKENDMDVVFMLG